MPEIEKTELPPPHAGHEDSDINVRAIIKFGAGMAALALVVHSLIAWQWFVLDRQIERADRKLPPLAAKERARLPQNLGRIPEPRLRSVEVQDLSALREREEGLLGSYEWVDQKKGVVRIPIERAIEVLSGEAAQRRGVRVRDHAANEPGKKGRSR